MSDVDVVLRKPKRNRGEGGSGVADRRRAGRETAEVTAEDALLATLVAQEGTNR